MAKKSKNKPVLFFLLLFVAIVGFSIFNNAKSNLIEKLMPATESITRVYTLGDSLVAVSQDSIVYTWDWAKLGIAEQRPFDNAGQIVRLADKVIWTEADGSALNIGTAAGKADKKIFFSSGLPYKLLQPSNNAKFAVAVAQRSSQAQIIRIDPGQAKVNGSYSLPETILNVAISDDGKLAAVCGSKEDKPWAAVVDMDRDHLLWHKADVCPKPQRLNFSPDSNYLYIAGNGHKVYRVTAADGEIQAEFEAGQFSLPNKAQYIAAITLSGDGKYLAAGTEPAGAVYFWNTTDKTRIGGIGKALPKTSIGPTMISALAFSPDSTKLAVADATSNKKVHVWKTPVK